MDIHSTNIIPRNSPRKPTKKSPKVTKPRNQAITWSDQPKSNQEITYSDQTKSNCEITWKWPIQDNRKSPESDQFKLDV